MSIFETIGICWVIFTSVIATIYAGYFAWKGIQSTKRHAQRGETEEHLDIRRAAEDRYLIDRAGRSAS